MDVKVKTVQLLLYSCEKQYSANLHITIITKVTKKLNHLKQRNSIFCLLEIHKRSFYTAFENNIGVFINFNNLDND